MTDAEITAAEVVFCEEFAGRTEAADLPHIRRIGSPPPAEEFGGLVFFQGMALVVLTYSAVFPADLAVLFRVRDTVFAFVQHAFLRWAGMDNEVFYFVFFYFGEFIPMTRRRIYEGDPLSPPEGEAAQGVQP